MPDEFVYNLPDSGLPYAVVAPAIIKDIVYGRVCSDDSCELSHCATCGHHVVGFLDFGQQCDLCNLLDDEKLDKYYRNKMMLEKFYTDKVQILS